MAVLALLAAPLRDAPAGARPVRLGAPPNALTATPNGREDDA